MLSVARLPRNTMMVLSLVQGLGLLLLWRAMSHETWPSQTPIVNFPLWTLVLAWPTLLLLSLEVGNAKRIFGLVSGFSGVLVLLAIYVGLQSSPANAFPIYSLVGAYAGTLVIACFKALMYLQQRAAGLPLTYEILFALSWRNFLVASFAGAFTAGVGGLLALWGALFHTLGIDFFRELFSQDWFLFPLLAVAFGAGVSIFRSLTGVLDGIVSLLEGLIRLLLPLVIAIMTIFLAALPFTGLTPLWETGKGTALLLWLNAITLFFINAVYQTGRHAPYPEIVHRLLYPGVALLPAVAALALYGLYLRVDQYGWTVERCWGLAVAVLLAMFSAGYLWEIARRRATWTNGLARVNITMGWVIVALMLLVNSPLLDFRSISLASQLKRIDSGELELREFDFDYTRTHLARPGFLKLQALTEQLKVSDPELAERISGNRGQYRPLGEAPEDFWGRVTYRPQRFDVPEGVKTLIDSSLKLRQEHEDAFDRDIAHPGRVIHMGGSFPVFGPEGGILVEGGFPLFELALGFYQDPVFIQVDLNDDDVLEYVLLSSGRDSGHVVGLCFYLADGVWNYRRVARVSPSLTAGARIPEVDVANALHQGEIEATGPAFQDLKIGDLILQVR